MVLMRSDCVHQARTGEQCWKLLYQLLARNLTSFVLPTLESHFGTSIKISRSVNLPSRPPRPPVRREAAAEANKAKAVKEEGRREEAEDQGREDGHGGKEGGRERALRRLACPQREVQMDVCRITTPRLRGRNRPLKALASWPFYGPFLVRFEVKASLMAA